MNFFIVLYNNANTFEAENYDSFKNIVETGFARAWWCGNAECKDQIKEETQATIRWSNLMEMVRVLSAARKQKRSQFFRAHTNTISE